MTERKRNSRPLTGLDLVFMLLIAVPWLAGVVLAGGFWGKALAVLIPPYAWYLLTEHVMTITGFIAGGCA